MNLRSSWLVIVSALAFGRALAAEFVANHLFVADRATHSIRELDAAGNILRVFAGSLLVDPQAMAFGADGLLYVLDERGSLATFDRIVVIAPEGDLVAETAVGPAASFDATGAKIVAGSRGRLLVSDAIGAEVHDFDVADGIASSYSGAPLAGTPAIARGPESRLYFSGGGDPVTISEFEPNGVVLATTSAAPTGGALPAPLLVRGPDGAVYRLTRPASGTTATLDALFATVTPPPLTLTNGPFIDLTFGPDGLLWILANGGTALVRVDRNLTAAVTLPFTAAAQGAAIAFAPFRFSAKISGKQALDGAGAKSVTETGVEFTYFAGADRVFVTLPDDPDDDDELADFYGAGAMPFAGYALRELDGDQVRFHGTYAERFATPLSSATVRLRFKGHEVASSGFFRVDDVTGDVVFGERKLSFAGSIRSAKRLE